MKTTNNNVLAAVQKVPFSCGKGPLEVDGRGFMTVLLVRFAVRSWLKERPPWTGRACDDSSTVASMLS